MWGKKRSGNGKQWNMVCRSEERETGGSGVEDRSCWQDEGKRRCGRK